VSEIGQRSIDREVIENALRDHRILLTEDKDFGWLVFASHIESPGVILIRFPGNARTALADTVRRMVDDHSARLQQAFIVVQPGHIRISHKPERQ
jgi:predicted nuclease of predicted toxin-antitoxin system